MVGSPLTMPEYTIPVPQRVQYTSDIGSSPEHVVGQFMGVHNAQWIRAVLAIDGNAEDAIARPQPGRLLRKNVGRLFQRWNAVQADASPDHLGQVNPRVGDGGFQNGANGRVDQRERVHLPTGILGRRGVFVHSRPDPLPPQAAVEIEVLPGEGRQSVYPLSQGIPISEEFERLKDDHDLGLVNVFLGVRQRTKGRL